MKKLLIAILVLAVGAGIGIGIYRWQNRPCKIYERQVREYYGFTTKEAEDNAIDFMLRMQLVKMYIELSNKGCPENRDYYSKQATLSFNFFDDDEESAPAVNVGLNVDMKKVGAAVNTAVDAAATAVGNALEKMKGTSINIKVE
ncbi:MAG: hypothetical protein LBL46_04735 [Rickettsiales bacterium]|jgi:hypothetical protein|nr:hypothetical protein [Rickettsiales bacterium]